MFLLPLGFILSRDQRFSLLRRAWARHCLHFLSRLTVCQNLSLWHPANVIKLSLQGSHTLQFYGLVVPGDLPGRSKPKAAIFLGFFSHFFQFDGLHQQQQLFLGAWPPGTKMILLRDNLCLKKWIRYMWLNNI